MKSRLYFAYGSNMDRLQMADRCPNSTFVSPAMLTDYRYKIDASGFATILTETDANVWGLIWQLTPACEATLDQYEGVDKGIYQKEMIEVKVEHEFYSCLVYILAYQQAFADRKNLPYLDYQEWIVQAAKESAFPSSYQQELDSWLPDPVRFPPEVWRAELAKQRASRSFY